MKSKYKQLVSLIQQVDERNDDLVTDKVLGISIEKEFMPSVANLIGTDLSKYKLLRKNLFACNTMHVGRDDRLPIALYRSDSPALVSPAYTMFEVVSDDIIPDYLMLCFKRNAFDKSCWFRTDATVRGGIAWADLCRVEVPLPSIDRQLQIVNAYDVISKRIQLKEQINKNLEAIMTGIFNKLYNHSNDGSKMFLGELLSFENGKARPQSGGKIPVYGGNGILAYTNHSNAKNVISIGRVGAYCGSVHLEKGDCWISDNAIAAKSNFSKGEYFDYFLLKSLNLYNHHVGTGQQLLTQNILNKIEVVHFEKKDITSFNALGRKFFAMVSKNNKGKKQLEWLQFLLLKYLSREVK